MLLALATLGCGKVEPPSVAPKRMEAGILCVDTKKADFGFSRDGKASVKVCLLNAGGGSIHIEEVRSGCGCTEAHLQKRQLEEGEKVILECLVDQSHGRTSNLTMDLDNGTARLSVRCTLLGKFRTNERTNGTLQIDLDGDIELPFAVQDNSCSLGNIPAFGGRTQHQLRVKPMRGYSKFEAMSRSPGIVIIDAEQPEATGQSSTIGIEVDPRNLPRQIARNEVPASVLVTASGLDRKSIAISVPLRLTITPPVSHSPARLVAGPLRVGESQEFLIKFRPDHCLFSEIESIDLISSHDDLSTCGFADEKPGMGARVLVRPNIAGLRHYKAKFRIRDVRSAVETDVEVPVTILAK